MVDLFEITKRRQDLYDDHIHYGGALRDAVVRHLIYHVVLPPERVDNGGSEVRWDQP